METEGQAKDIEKVILLNIIFSSLYNSVFYQIKLQGWLKKAFF
jgi:hypothetical protein